MIHSVASGSGAAEEPPPPPDDPPPLEEPPPPSGPGSTTGRVFPPGRLGVSTLMVQVTNVQPPDP